MKSRLYTRTGDDGTTSLVGGSRVPKDCERLEAYGTVDELNSLIGLVAASSAISPQRRRQLTEIQNRLFDIGACLATEPQSEWQPVAPDNDTIGALEAIIDDIDSELPPLRQFVIPGGHPAAAHAHMARTVARRAERRIIALDRTERVDQNIIRYINRLSDLLFALAREININNSVDEILWQKPCR